MKYSMYIFEHYLKKYQPVSMIKSEEPTILGVKLFSYDKTPDPDYLYVGHNNDFFYGSESREVLLVHRKDVISLATSELEDVFNDVMECISYYSSWEQKLLSAYNSPSPEQTIVDSCADIFGPMFFTTMSLQITAISRQYPKGSINPNWDDFLETGTLSIERFSRLRDGYFLNNHNQIWDCEVFYESSVESYPYSLMVSQVNAGGKLTGQLTIISEEPFEEYQKHLIPPLKRAICLVSNTFGEGDRNSIAQSIFLDLVEGSKKETAIQEIYDLMGWSKNQICSIAVVKHPNSRVITYGYDVELLQKEFPDGLFCVHDDGNNEHEIVCLLPNLQKKEESKGQKFVVEEPQRFYTFMGRMGFEYGVSYPLEGVENLDIQYQQARSAVRRGVRRFYECAMYEMVGFEGSPAYRKAAIHPAVDYIREYDQEKKTDYYRMLETYLHNERDRVKTSDDLYIHKNTLVYRLKKLETLFGIDFDDTYDREYLLISINSMNNLE